MNNEEIILTIGNMELRLTKDSEIQIRAKEGIATLESGFEVKQGNVSIKLTAPFTTTSTGWIDITGISFDEIPFDPKITPEEKTRLKKGLSYLNENKPFLLQLANFVTNLSKYFQ